MNQPHTQGPARQNDGSDLDSRTVAHAALSQILRRRRTLDQSFHAEGLPTRDRAFARLLVATVLRRLGQIDEALARFIDRGIRPEAAEEVLRIGAAQLLFLGTPPHAAVDTSVRLAERLGATRQKGMINAVLRRIDRARDEILAEQDEVRLNFPAWLLGSWTKAYGEDMAIRIARASLTEAPLDLTVKSDPAAWATQLEAELLPTGTLRRTAGGNVAELPGYEEGAWWVQDAAAALPARLFGPLAGRSVIDLCAAPGGKTAQLAAAGATVTALDRSAERLQRIEANLARLGLKARLIAEDARQWRSSDRFDAVLLDAPCTATGAIRRNPDVPHAKQPTMLADLVRTQAGLIDAAVALVAPGGTLIYCTCSLQPEEGERQVRAALGRHPQLQRWPIEASEIGGWSELLDPDGQIRSTPAHLPEIGGIDGFFVARLRLS